MSSSNENNHEFFEVLSGKKEGNATAEALRKALIDEALAIKQVEENTLEKLSESELARLETVKLELIKKGIFQPYEANQHVIIYYIDRIQQYLANHFWQTLKVASVSAILLLTFFLFQLNQSDSRLSDLDLIVKNESKKLDSNTSAIGAITINPQHSEADFDKLKKNLKDAGAEIVETRVSKNEWGLEVFVPATSKKEDIKALLIQSGIKISAEPPYRITIKMNP